MPMDLPELKVVPEIGNALQLPPRIQLKLQSDVLILKFAEAKDDESMECGDEKRWQYFR